MRAHHVQKTGAVFSSKLVFAAKVAVIGAGTACYVLAGTVEAALLAATHAPSHTCYRTTDDGFSEFQVSATLHKHWSHPLLKFLWQERDDVPKEVLHAILGCQENGLSFGVSLDSKLVLVLQRRWAGLATGLRNTIKI